jgi:hypothetical protein
MNSYHIYIINLIVIRVVLFHIAGCGKFMKQGIHNEEYLYIINVIEDIKTDRTDQEGKRTKLIKRLGKFTTQDLPSYVGANYKDR